MRRTEAKRFRDGTHSKGQKRKNPQNFLGFFEISQNSRVFLEISH